MASRYWVGGTGSWTTTNTTNWSTTSGGSGGASVPTTLDAVFFDLFSGTGTVTTAPSVTCEAMTINRTGITLTLGAAFVATGVVTLTIGNLNLAGYSLTCVTFSSSNTNTRSIAFGTTGQFFCTGSGAIWNTGTTTGLTITGTNPTINYTYAGLSASTFAAGTTLGVSNLLSLNITAGTYSLTTSAMINNLNFTGYSGTFRGGSLNLYGSLTLSPTMGVSAPTSTLSFLGTSGTQLITTNGVLIDMPVVFNGIGGTFKLQDALTIGTTRTITLTNGTFDADIYNVTTGLFASNNANTRSLSMGSGTWTLSSVGTVWNLATVTGLTFNANTSTISLTDTSVTARTFAGGSLTYNVLSIDGLTGISDLSVSGNNTFNTFRSTKPVAHRILFTNASTQTISNWGVSGSSGNSVTVSSTSSTRANLVKAGGGIVSADYLRISNTNATPSTNTWYAGAHSLNLGNNIGWLFVVPPLNYTLSASAGTYSETGVAATLTYVAGNVAYNYTLTASTGAYSEAGIAATLVYVSGAGAYNYTLSVSTGVYSCIGMDASFRLNKKLIASRGSYTYTKNAADLNFVSKGWQPVDNQNTPTWQNLSTTQTPTWAPVNTTSNPLVVLGWDNESGQMVGWLNNFGNTVLWTNVFSWQPINTSK